MKWSTVFSIGGKEGEGFPLAYQRGLLQGDSLSLLLFCLCVAPLSYTLNEEDGVESESLEGCLPHLFFMDDLKVYTWSDQGLNRSLLKVDQVSRAVGMELGLRKRATAHMIKGRLKKAGFPNTARR